MDKVKKTLVSFFSHSSQLGGSERSLLELIKELKEKNISSHVVLPDNGPLEKELAKINTPYDIVRLSWWTDLSAKNSQDIDTTWASSLKNLTNYLPKLSLVNPDLIYTNTIASPWGSIAAEQLNKPHIWHIREYGELDHKLIFDVSYSQIVQFIEDHSQQIITNSKSVSKHISQYLKSKKPVHSYNYISIDKDLPNKKIKSPFKNKKSLKVLVCGTIHKGKNQLEALQAIKDIPQTELLLMGGVADNNYLNNIKEYIKKYSLEDKVHLLNFVKNQYPYFKLVDVVLITSHKEAFGRTAIEAMLLKKPVISTVEGGTSEIVKDQISGYLYKQGDLKNLKKIIIKLSSRRIREKIGTAGFNLLPTINNKDNYGYKIAKIIKETIKTYQPKESVTRILANIFTKSTEEKNLLFNQIELIQQEKENQAKQIEEINKVISNYQSENQSLKKRIEEVNQNISNVQTNLNKITSSKYYKMWRLYCKFKDIINNDKN